MDSNEQSAPEQISPQPREQNTPSNTSWLRTLSVGFSIVSFCLAIGVGGYILGIRKNQAVSQNQQGISPTPSINETANWQIYSAYNKDYSFKYPSSWTNDVNGEQFFETGIMARTKDLENPDWENLKKGAFVYKLFMTDLISGKDVTLSSVFAGLANSNQYKSATIIEEKDFKLDGLPAKMRILKFSKTLDEAQVAFTYPNNKGYSWMILISADSEFNAHQNEFNQMLSTFKFTDQVAADSTNWKTYKDHYGEYTIQYPFNWSAGQCIGGEGGDPAGCYIFSLGESQSMDTIPIISLNISLLTKTDTSRQYNFIIPAISGAENAVFKKESTSEIISFDKNSIHYELQLDLDEAKKLGFKMADIESIFTRMAKSVTLLQEPSTCANPALVPFDNFPENFSLSTYHDSDTSDPVTSYWPSTKPDSKSAQDLAKGSSYDSFRGFMVNYVKAESSFKTNASFLKTVTPIIGTKEPSGGFEKDTTSIWHIGCIDTQEGGDMYFVSANENNPFAVHLYGSANNPNTLWGVAKWNLNLLKTTRNTVYIKLGDFLQTYTAVGYFATLPTARGGKPAIYLYPKNSGKVTVAIHPRGKLTKTDKYYNSKINGWNVLVNTDGKINNDLSSLYYEAMVSIEQPKTGYVIPYNNLWEFTKTYVEKLGLNATETDAFINFWKINVPAAPYYFVSHLDQETINTIYPLQIDPTPTSLIRVEIYFKPLEKYTTFKEPVMIDKPVRDGFTAVEWGGILDAYK